MRGLLVRAGFAFEDPRDEESFADSYVRRHWRTIFALGLAAGALNYGFALLGLLIDPVGTRTLHLIRALTLVLIVIVAGVGSLPSMRRWLEPVMIATLAAIAGTLALETYVAEQVASFWGLVFVLMVVAETNLFQMRLSYYLVASASMVVAATAVAVHVPLGAATIVSAASVVAAVVIGVVGVMRREQVARREWRLMREVEVARGRIEQLLHTMLPVDVAQRIQAGATTVADDHPEVAIVFADLVGFTALSRRISAAELVELLNSIFSAIDRLAEQHGVERIKTIGDCYMAASGLASGAPDPARATADFALALPAVVAEASAAAGHPLQARVGLHVGPVVAGVIGVQRPAFDCWGASVNLASRLETAAAPGEVLVSAEASLRLGPGYVVTGLPAEDLKGFGPTPLYRLEGQAR